MTAEELCAGVVSCEREERLETAVDALRERFGGGSVRRGTVLEKKEREGE